MMGKLHGPSERLGSGRGRVMHVLIRLATINQCLPGLVGPSRSSADDRRYSHYLVRGPVRNSRAYLGDIRGNRKFKENPPHNNRILNQ